MLSLAILLSLLAADRVQSFVTARAGTRAEVAGLGRFSTFGKARPVEEDDPYDLLLDLDKPIESDAKKTLLPTLSISSSKGASLAPRTRKPVSILRNKKPWAHWDEWMEQEFGDLDAELEEKDKWLLELRDIVEQKRGFAIWSKKSDKEIQREVKKNQANKGIQMPESVASVIRAVFLERTHTMKEYKRDNELACIEFRKWMIEQKQKLKKDPLPIAKVEVSKKWILKHPGSGNASRKKGQLPPVVMDECIEPVPGVALASDSFSSSSRSSSGLSGNSASSSSSSSNTLVTSSMLNWEKSSVELEAELASGSPSSMTQGNIRARSTFVVDDEEIFVASNTNKEYFVVI